MNMLELNTNHLYILNNLFEEKLDANAISSSQNFMFDFIKS